jgi:predicted DNA-binding transcriptional regulator AlpA
VSAPRRSRTTAHARRQETTHPAAQTAPAAGRTHREQLTVNELCAELKVARRTFYDWRAKGRAPRCLKLPNGDLRIRRVDFDAWLAAREEA